MLLGGVVGSDGVLLGRVVGGGGGGFITVFGGFSASSGLFSVTIGGFFTTIAGEVYFLCSGGGSGRS